MKAKIKQWLRTWLEDKDYAPQKSRDLRAVSFKDKDPVGNGKYHEYLFHCMEWDNGEGHEFHINWYYNGKSVDKHISLNSTEMNGIFACLNDLGYFKI
jgi:hypothetical protein